MTTKGSIFLLSFRKCNTPLGVTRETLKELAHRLRLSQAQVVHLALARMAEHELQGYESGDGPISEIYHRELLVEAAAALPVDQIVARTSLFLDERTS